MDMSAPAIDRRVARTRAMLQQALRALVRTKGYEAVTIKDICDAANVGRSTFYAHFAGKDDLKRSGFESLRRELAARQTDALAGPPESREAFGFSHAMFAHARDHLDLYRALVGGHGGAVALGRIRQILSELVHNELAAAGRDTRSADAMPREFMVQYVVGAYMAVLTWWLDGGAKLSPERVDAMFRQLVTQGVIRPAQGPTR